MQFIDLKAQYKRIHQSLETAINETMTDGRFIMGPAVISLEERLAKYTGRKYCLSCASGTEALHLALMALGIGAGDAVFVPDFTFFATAEVVSLVGATPIFVDIDKDTFNISAASLERAIKAARIETNLKLKAIIPVDLFGQPADYNAIEKIAIENDLYIIEDSAQGFGGVYHDKRDGSFGIISATSFFPAKPLGCYGDGGAIFCDDDDIYKLLKSLRVHGSGSDKYDNVRIGLNSRLDTVQATVLGCKMDIFDDELISRDRTAKLYTEELSDISQIITPTVADGCFSSWAQYTLLLPDTDTRTKLMASLKAEGIPSMIYYATPMHSQTAFNDIVFRPEKCENASYCSARVMSLPMHPYLEETQIKTICEAVRRFFK